MGRLGGAFPDSSWKRRGDRRHTEESSEAGGAGYLGESEELVYLVELGGGPSRLFLRDLGGTWGDSGDSSEAGGPGYLEEPE